CAGAPVQASPAEHRAWWCAAPRPPLDQGEERAGRVGVAVDPTLSIDLEAPRKRHVEQLLAGELGLDAGAEVCGDRVVAVQPRGDQVCARRVLTRRRRA